MIKPISYLQTDPKWKSHNYSAKGESRTIGSSGCGITCAAMVIATLVDKTVTPVTTAEWSMANGYKALDQGTYYSYFTPQGKKYGLDWKKLNTSNLRNVSKSVSKPIHSQALSAIKNGDMVICCMGVGNWTSGGHYILWYGIDGTNVLINDPASTRTSKLKAPLETLQNEVKYYFVCKTPVSKTSNESNDNLSKTEDDEMIIYKTIKDVPDWAKETVTKLMSKKLLNGGENGVLNLEHNMLRGLVINDRAGLYK